MVAAVREAPRQAGVEKPIRTVLDDGGYWNSRAIDEARSHNMEVLAPTQDRRRSKPRKLSPAKAPRHRGDADPGRHHTTAPGDEALRDSLKCRVSSLRTRGVRRNAVLTTWEHRWQRT
jgi:hypothetical protein